MNYVNLVMLYSDRLWFLRYDIGLRLRYSAIYAVAKDRLRYMYKVIYTIHVKNIIRVRARVR